MNIIMRLSEIAEDIREIIKSRQDEIGLYFEEKDHIYTMMKRTDYPSVSKVIKKFYEEFPVEEASYKKAKGDLEVQKKLIKEWAEAGLYSTNIGSRVHYFLEKKLIENYGNYKEIRQPIFECDLVQTMKSDAMISAGKKYIELMKERGCELLDTEMVLGDPELGYTGQPDKVWLINNKDNSSFGLLITDWKTNQPKNFKETKWTGKMYPPFQNYPNNALGHYYLQLPLYGKLLLKMLEGTKYENLKLFGCIITHLTDDGIYKEYRIPRDIIDTILQMKLDFIMEKN
jgi:hypothetical protein